MKKLAPLEKSHALLFTYWVNSSMGYNALEIDDERFIKRIIKNKDLQPNHKVETYTGISIIDLARIDRVAGVSKFFESVCPYHQKNIPTVLLEKVDYWDFGTVRRYWETMFQILRTYKTNSTHPFMRFLIQEKALKTWKIDLQKLSYHAGSKEVINLTQDNYSSCLGPSIILSGAGSEQSTNPTIIWNGYSEQVKLDSE
jgi:hypothetical protein